MAFLRKNYEKIGRTRLRGKLPGKGLKIHKTLDKHSDSFLNFFYRQRVIGRGGEYL